MSLFFGVWFSAHLENKLWTVIVLSVNSAGTVPLGKFKNPRVSNILFFLILSNINSCCKRNDFPKERSIGRWQLESLKLNRAWTHLRPAALSNGKSSVDTLAVIILLSVSEPKWAGSDALQATWYETVSAHRAENLKKPDGCTGNQRETCPGPRSWQVVALQHKPNHSGRGQRALPWFPLMNEYEHSQERSKQSRKAFHECRL